MGDQARTVGLCAKQLDQQQGHGASSSSPPDMDDYELYHVLDKRRKQHRRMGAGILYAGYRSVLVWMVISY